MQVSYFNFLSCPLVFILGFTTILFLALNRNVNFSGLSVAALSDALMSLFTSAVSVYKMLNANQLCDSKGLLLHQSTILMPFINGLLSTVLWNYQCWNKIKVERKTNVSINVFMPILPQYFILALMLLYVLMCTPEKHISYTEKNDYKSNYEWGNILTFINKTPCPNNQLNETLTLFENFLQDINKSKSSILFYDGRVNYPNDTEEIVQKIYRLVYEQINSSKAVVNTVQTKRVPKAHQQIKSDELKTANDSVNNEFTDEFDYTFYDNTTNNNKKFVDNNATDSMYNNKKNYHSIILGKNIINKKLTEKERNSTRQFGISETNCYVICRMQDTDEKVLLCVLLFICYMIPVFCALFLYGKASMEAIHFSEHNINHETLLRSARWGLITPVMMLTPLLFSLFMGNMLKMTIPEWLSSILYSLSQVHPFVKNIINIVTIKKCSNIKGSNKVNPTPDEDDSDVVIEMPEIINKQVTEAWVTEEKS